MIYRRGSIKQFFKGDPRLGGYWRLFDNSIDYAKQNNGSDTNILKLPTRFNVLEKCYGFRSSNLSGVDTSLNIAGLTNATVGFWIRKTTDGFGQVFSNTVSGSDGYIGTNTPLKIRVHQQYNGYTAETPNNSLKLNKWHFIAVTMSNVTGQGVKIYIDGILMAQNTTAFTWNSNTQGLHFGYGHRNPINYGFIDADVFDIFLFYRILSPTEISAYYKWAIGKRNKSIFIIDVPSVINARRRLLIST